MKAIVQDAYGRPTCWSSGTSQAEVGDNEVLVRVHAAGVDRGVWHLMTGQAYLIRLAGYGVRRPRTPFEAARWQDGSRRPART